MLEFSFKTVVFFKPYLAFILLQDMGSGFRTKLCPTDSLLIVNANRQLCQESSNGVTVLRATRRWP